MLRIAVNGLSPDALLATGQRLHRAIVEFCDSPGPEDPVWQSAEAIAFFNPTSTHAAAIEIALSGGKHVLAVARAGLRADQLGRLSALARKQSVLLAVKNPDHALPSRRLIRQQIDDGKLGDIGLVRIQRSERPDSAANGDVNDISAALVGDLETALRIVGRGPDTVYAVRRSIELSAAAHGDTLHVHLGFSSGAMALLTMTTALPAGDSHQSLSVIASTGAAYSDGHQNRQLLFGGGPATAPQAEEGDVAAVLIDEFATASQNASRANDRLQSWSVLGKLVDAVKQSLAAEQAVCMEVQ